MTAEAAAGPTADFGHLPSWTLDDDQLADLELLLSGAFAPLTGFMGSADVAAVGERGTLADGTPWPVPVTLDVPEAAVAADQRRLALADPEETPVAVLGISERSPAPVTPLAHHSGAGRHARSPGPAPSGLVRLSGPVTQCRDLEHGPFRHLRRSPAQVRAEIGDGPVLALVTRRPLHSRQIGQLRHVAGQLRARLLLLPAVTGPAEQVVRPEALVRAVRAAARHLPQGTLVVPVPLPAHGLATDRETALHALVAAAYGATHLLADSPHAGIRADRDPSDAVPTSIPVVSAGDWAYDRSAEVWRPLSLIDPGTERPDLTAGELEDLLDRGEEVPAWFTPPAVAAELRRARPPRSARGLVVFMTGLPGSGKSTLARGLRDALSERGDRVTTLLEADLVHEMLSARLGFSPPEGDPDITLTGFVASEVARHGGIAICAQVAPYAGARARVRRMVREAGDFLLIHLATPADVCEARDRKGRYAKARAGLIDHFSGISGPYEEPRDADLTVDASTMARQECLDAVLHLLSAGGWVPSPEPGR